MRLRECKTQGRILDGPRQQLWPVLPLMNVAFFCPGCGKKYTKPDELGGCVARCRGCRKYFSIPKPRQAGPFPPDELEFACSHCGKSYETHNSIVGRRVCCGACHFTFTLPETNAVPYEAPRPAPAAVPAPASAAKPRPAAGPPPKPRPAASVSSPVLAPAPAPATPQEGIEILDDDDDFIMMELDDDDGLAAVVVAPVGLLDRPVRPRPLAMSGELRVLAGLAVLGFLTLVFVGVMFWRDGGTSALAMIGVDAGLDPDDQPDPELDDPLPSDPVRRDVVAGHEQALRSLIGPLKRMTAAVVKAQNFSLATEAGQDLERASNDLVRVSTEAEARKLPRPNANELRRLSDLGAPQEARATVRAFVAAVTQTMKANPAVRQPFQPMRVEFEKLARQFEADYPEPNPLACEIKVVNLPESREANDRIRRQIDDLVPGRKSVRSSTDGNARVLRYRFSPLTEDVRELANRITFGKVVKVVNRRIKVSAGGA
ncbi:MAG: hypothetical protein U0835_04910 [Isosphaeraceae bacterium]